MRATRGLKIRRRQRNTNRSRGRTHLCNDRQWQRRLTRLGPITPTRNHMSWRGYIAFGILSLLLAFLSVFLWMINPVTDLLLLLAAPPLRLFGYHPPVQGFSGLGSAMWVSFLWPLTLLPL